MKSETLNGILTFVLGVLVVLGVVFALRVVFVSKDFRALQNQAGGDSTRLAAFQSMVNDVQAYNQKYPSVELQHILQSLQPPAAKP